MQMCKVSISEEQDWVDYLKLYPSCVTLRKWPKANYNLPVLSSTILILLLDVHFMYEQIKHTSDI